MHPLKLLAILAVALPPAIGLSQTPVTAPVFQVQPGPLPVGLKVIEQYDHTRTFGTPLNATAKPDRPLQTLLWYPATTTGRVMKVKDYLALTKTETSFAIPKEDAPKHGLAHAVDAHAEEPMRATRDAPLAAGRYPVVIYSPSFSAPSWESADLCEYLAGHGYVVLAAPAMGAQARDSTHDLDGTEAQAKDISFLLTYAESLPDTDITKVAAVGFSWGGLANLFAASQDNRIRALVSLEGSERYFPGLVKSSGHIDPEQMKIPLLYFQEGDHSLEMQDELNSTFHSDGPSVLNHWRHADLITAHMLGLFHPSFYSMSYRHESLWKNELPNLQVADYDRNDALLQFSWVMRYTRVFLDANLRQDADARKFLESTPRANGIPNHMMSIKLRPAAP